MEANPFPAVWAGSATTRARPPATAASSTRRSASTRSNGSSVTRRSRRAGRSPVTAAADRPAGAGRGCGPGRPVGGLPPGAAGSRGHLKEAGAVAGGMMRYGIPRYRLPRDGARRRDRSGCSTSASRWRWTPASPTWTRRWPRRAATRPSWPWVPSWAAAPTSRPASAAHVLDAVCVLHGLEEGERPLLGRRVAVYGGGNTAIDAARTARRLGRRGRGRRLPPHPGADAGPRDEVAEAEEEGVRFRWLSTIERGRGRPRSSSSRWSSTRPGSRSRPGAPRGWPPTRVVLALGQDTDLSLLPGSRASTSADGVVAVDARHDDRPPRRLRRRRRGGGGAVGDGRHRARPAWPPGASTTGWPASPARPSRRVEPGAVRRAQHLVLRGRATHPPAAPRAVPAAVDVRRGGRRASTATPRSTRRGAACRAAAASRATTASPCAPTTPSSRSACRASVRDRPRLLQGLRDLRRRVPVRRDRDGPRGDLNGGRATMRTYRAVWAVSTAVVDAALRRARRRDRRLAATCPAGSDDAGLRRSPRVRVRRRPPRPLGVGAARGRLAGHGHRSRRWGWCRPSAAPGRWPASSCC